MSVNFPEEDGVEHRVEPQTWPTDGDAEDAVPEPDAFGFDADGPAGAGGESADHPGHAGYADHADHAGYGDDARYGDRGDRGGYGDTAAFSVGAGAPPSHDFNAEASAASPAADAVRMGPSYPVAAVPHGSVSKITAPFSMLTRTRTKPPRQPKPPKPAKTTRPATVQKKPGPRPQEGRPPQPGGPGAAPTRKAQLVLSRIEPWSVMKFSFMISLVGWVVLFVAVAGIYLVLARIGVFRSIENTIGQVTFSKGHPGSNASSWFAASRVLGYTMLVGAVNVVLITALSTVGAVVYNVVTHLAGGIEVTLKETD
jgi:Transmembrane domain of unknown function (DUF3566)